MSQPSLDHGRRTTMRAVGVIGLAGIALIHLLDVQGKFAETPYMGWMYIGLMIGCVVIAGRLIATDDPRAWLAAAVLPLTAIVGYCLSRTTGLPQANGDIGNWTEPLGLASLFVEGSLVALSAGALLDLAPARAAQGALSLRPTSS
jgi:hypothetical protein